MIVLFVDMVYACNYTTVINSDNNIYPREPKISGRNIVFDYFSEVYRYDLGQDLKFNTSDDLGLFLITNNSYIEDPNVYGNLITWIEYNETSEVYLCDVNRNGDYGGCLYNDSKIQITNHTSFKRNPLIFEDKIFWEDYLNGNFDIFMCSVYCNQSYVKQITNNISNQINLDVSNDLIVYEDDRNGNADLYFHNLNSKKEYPLVIDYGAQRKPKIFLDYFILWDTNKNGNDDIYIKSIGYDLIPYTADDSYDVLITNSSFDEYHVAVGKGKGFWQTSKYNSDSLEGGSVDGEIFEIFNNNSNFLNPSVYGNNIVFEAYSNTVRSIMIAEC